MLITTLVFVLIAVIIGVAAWKNLPKTEISVNKKDHPNGEHPYKLKEAVNIEAAQELHPFEETKESDALKKIKANQKRNHIKAVPHKAEEKVKSPVQAVPHKVEEKVKSPVQTVPHKVEEKVKSPVQAVSHKAEKKVKSPVQTVPHKVEKKVKSPVHAVPHKAEKKVKSPVHAVPHKVEEKAKSRVQAVHHKVEENVKSTVQDVTYTPEEKVQAMTYTPEEKIISVVQAVTHKAEEKIKSIEKTVPHKAEEQDKNTVLPIAVSQVHNTFSASAIKNELPHQQVLSQNLSSSAVVPFSLDKQLDNIEITENKLQSNVYNTLIQQLDEASDALAQINEQIKLVELMNYIDDEITKISTTTEHQ